VTTAPPRTQLLRWQDPTPLRETFQREGGLVMLSGIVDGLLPPAPMTELLGFKLVEVEAGRTVWIADPDEQHHNEVGLVHGGLAAGLLDTALGTTVVSALPAGTRCASLNLHVDFLRPLVPGGGRVRCEGRIVRLGSRIVVADAELSDAAGEALARASSTVSIVRAT